MPAPVLEHTYADAVPQINPDWPAGPAAEPRVVLLNEALAAELGLDADWLRGPEGIAFLTGHGGGRTVAQGYAGHQFGGFSPRLGDGRALLLGELVDAAGVRRDLHLKGSGRTPWSRGGDGLAALGPMLREYVMGEAMHALGIPTTRALAVLTTGGTVVRERLLPGAILVRVAASHLRVGTVQLAATSGDEELLRAVVAYAIKRHDPEADGPLAFLAGVAQRQARLVAQWMGVGFVHGVMNTDNMTLSGETIDYGPCAFLDAHDPAVVFSSIDHQGRYAYGNQPALAQWDLTRLAECLIPLLGDDVDAAVAELSEVLSSLAGMYEAELDSVLAAKLGLVGVPEAGALGRELWALLATEKPDHTGFFPDLAAGRQPAAFDEWAARWRALGPDVDSMGRANPVYVPRNHAVEEALAAATAGDLAPLHRLLDAVTNPYEERPGLADLAEPAPLGLPPHVTYCGT